MQTTTHKIELPGSVRTTFYLSEEVTYAGLSYIGDTSERAFAAGISGVLARMWTQLAAAGEGEGSVLVDRAAAYRLGLRADSPAEALANARGSGWSTSREVGLWTTFYAEGRPTVYVGQLDELLDATAAEDMGAWPFERDKLGALVFQLQHWHRLTGIAWQAGPAVMGIELMHRHLPSYRIPGERGTRRPAKRDLLTPRDADEGVWTPALWRRPMADVSRETSGADVIYLHKYDKTRAGITAAGVAKLCPSGLTHTRKRPYDPKAGGWWLISVPPWNEPRLPHPCGPGADVWERKWVTTATMDLLAELAERGEIDMPEVIDSYTGPARQILAPWTAVLEEAYQAPLIDGLYVDDDREHLRAAVKEVGTRGLGMLAHTVTDDEGTVRPASTIFRRDWFAGVNATKRCNGWRLAHKIGRTEDRWPAWIDDDSIVYASSNSDPYASAPAEFSAQIGAGRVRVLDGDQPGDYRVQETITARRAA